ncbi:hypothetical protein EX30DRAFT_341140 [Ascodesmis nigricans]|uniref:Uncharacterized protein n=1 Tax=Ascodesmis nigricans TaxID=341454 RepID=A0A4S2MWA2_9PEZI|nr:hypothetical protein EX30DRAFT_341140 [Ascodesmis nigricans]
MTVSPTPGHQSIKSGHPTFTGEFSNQNHPNPLHSRVGEPPQPALLPTPSRCVTAASNGLSMARSACI